MDALHVLHAESHDGQEKQRARRQLAETMNASQLTSCISRSPIDSPSIRRPRPPANDESASSTSTSVSPITPRQLLPHCSRNENDGVDDDASDEDDEDDDDDDPSPPSVDAVRPSLADTHAYKPSISPKVLGRGGSGSLSSLPGGSLDEPIGGGGPARGKTVPPARRTPWTVQDSNLRPRPSSHPPLMDRGPLSTTTSAVVTHTTPSVVAVRISEALRRWPAAVEYDEESSTATAWTSDRCCLAIHLWRSSASSSSAGWGDVLVECVRVRGSPLTFGHLCQTVLNAAQGMVTGDDLRRAHQTSVLEMGERWEQRPSEPGDDGTPNRRLLPVGAHVSTSVVAQDLELVDGLLQKDRWDAHQLGLERLVGLLDVFTSGVETAVVVSRSLVMKPDNYRFLWRLIVDRAPVVDDDHSASSATTLGGIGVGGDDDLLGFQRSIALRALANALTVLDLYDAKRTAEKFSLAESVPGLLFALLEDVATGPSRPPSVTGLAGPHEAVYAIRCLRHLGLPGVDDDDKEQALEDLERARSVGYATNAMLEREARLCYLALTEVDRSC